MTEGKTQTSWLKPIGILVGCVMLVLAGALGWAWVDLMHYADQPTQVGKAPQVFEIRSGANLKTIARDMARAGIITHPLKFQVLARVENLDRRLQAGEYLLGADQSPRRILTDLVQGRVRLYRLTIPEGYTLAQVVQVVAESGLAGAADFERELSSPDYTRELGISAKHLEGYLFPDTYLFPKNASASRIVGAMVERFQEVFKAAWRERAAELGFSLHEIVTLAAIIEKETGQSGERALISAVFHNRLKKKMRLQSDPTVIYGIKNFDGNLTRRHLKTPTPYNTYTNPGLPPGPIANPGEAALKAALYPADSPFLYFVAKKDGSHQFSTRYKDHLRAVRKYQLSP